MNAETILDKITSRIKEENKGNFSGFKKHRFILRNRSKPIDIISRFKAGFVVIAEVKKGSPSRGIIRKQFDPIDLALQYKAGGAEAISVVTEKNFFFGEPEFLHQIRKNVDLPLLRKDFIIHPYQVFEAYNLGADFILLIVAVLDDNQLILLHQTAEELGLRVLIEVHNEDELERLFSLEIDFNLIGINNRNLKTFKVDINNSFRLKKKVDEISKKRKTKIYLISESGIKGKSDITRLKKAGFNGVLIGESLLKLKNIKRGLSRWLK